MLVRDTAVNLQRVGDDLEFLPGSPEERAGILLALCSFRLEDLATPIAPAMIAEATGREIDRLQDAAEYPPRMGRSDP